jgi:hypothetical protein
LDDIDLELTEESVARRKEILKDLRGLVNHPGWLYTAAVLRSQAEQRFIAIGQKAPTDIPEVLVQAAERGEANAMLILASLPDNLVAYVESDLQTAGVILEDETEDGESLNADQ